MAKISVVVLADTESHADLGRIANALTTVKEAKDAGDDVELIFDGAGAKWPGTLSNPDHRLAGLFDDVRDRVAGVCEYCAGAFGVKDEVHAAGVAFLSEYRGHPSLRRRVADGYEVITF